MSVSSKFKPDSYIKAIEDNFTIVDKGVLPGGDEEPRGPMEVPFKLNPAQLNFLKNATDNNIILKARKMGFSSVLLAVACIKFLFGKNERCVSMSFDKEASSKQLDRAKHFIKSYEYKNKVKVPLKYNTRNELVWEGVNPDGSTFTNTLRVGTAKSTGFGRGDDITFLHLTEVSMADHLDQLLAGVGEAVVHNAMTTLETTANGYNDFKSLWDEAVLGNNNFKGLFYDPSWEYDQAYLDDRKRKLKHLFDQEYPATPELAFITSGRLYFDRLALKELLDRAKEPINA
jgi:hypothetical protein